MRAEQLVSKYSASDSPVVAVIRKRMKEIRELNAVGMTTFVYVPADINKFPNYRMAFDIIH